MTMSGEFTPIDDNQDFEARRNYPTAFGVPLTPTVIGSVLGVALFGLAIYLFFLLVRPALQTRQQLSQEIEEKQDQLDNVAEREQQLQEARDRKAAAEQLQQDVLALFATEDSLDTLLLDLNERVQSVNAGIEDEDRRAVLSLFEVGESAIVTDSSLGEAVNGRIERRTYNVEMRGNYAQTQSILRNIERLQPLLLVRDFQSTLNTSERTLQVDLQGNLVPAGTPVTRLDTSFELDALLPVPPDELPPEPTPTADPAAEGEAAPADQPEQGTTQGSN
ncbi:MAG: pilus assembly protein PilO [Elainellaceae cyanobacterium]